MTFIPARDKDGRGMTRTVIAREGWTLFSPFVELETCQLTSLNCQLEDATQLAGLTLKFYNSSDVELTTQASIDTDCVKTVLDFEPAYDYEILGGEIDQLAKPAQGVRIWVIAIPDLTEAQGGTKRMIINANLKKINKNDSISIDGKTCKFLKYDAVTHTNKLRFTLKHNAGFRHPVMIQIKAYKA